VSTAAASAYGRAVSALRSMTQATVNKEPKWRHARAELTTGYHPRTY
jgi:hydrogenase small subunit